MLKFDKFPLIESILELLKETDGLAVVEAAILFPVMIMIFAALVLLSFYLPTRAALQHATQYAATVMATEKSDTWLFFDEASMSYRWETDKSNLDNVYVALIKTVVPGSDDADKAETIVRQAENKTASFKLGELSVEYGIVNYIIYKEIIVTATRTIPVAIDLSFIGFPREMPITVTSTAVVSNGDEFIRNADMAVDFFEFISDKFGLDGISESIKSFGNNLTSILGW